MQLRLYFGSLVACAPNSGLHNEARFLTVSECLKRRKVRNRENHEGSHAVSPGKELSAVMHSQGLQVPAPANRNVVQSPTSCEKENNHECDRNGLE